MPKMLNMLNLAGFGMKAWDKKSESPAIPFSYSSDGLPMFDRNLKSLAEKVHTNCLLAHVRGVPGTTEAAVSVNNNHPFCFPNCKISLAHNGNLAQFGDMKALLVPFIDERIFGQIAGATDSEWIYALLLSQLADPTDYLNTDELKRAIEGVFRIIRDIRIRCDIDICSSANLFISDGQHVVAVRYCFDFGRYPIDNSDSVYDYHMKYLSLWYTLGREYGYYDGEWQTVGGGNTADTVIIASEPLTADVTTWLEVPEYSMLCASTSDGSPRISLDYLDI
jgi:glutamine amidotransferase